MPTSANIKNLVGELRDLFAGDTGSPGAAVDDLFKRIDDALAVLLAEHAGMANELLRVYQQLGIVFEVGRRLPTVSHETEVIRLFLDSLSEAYYDSTVEILHLERDGSFHLSTRSELILSTTRAALCESIEARRVTVRRTHDSDDWTHEVLTAPVFVGQKLECAIIITHEHTASGFDASDMSLLDALSLYMGDLLRNYRLVDELRSLSVDMVRALVSAVDQKDAYTSGHSNRVGHYATLLGQELGLSGEDLQMLEWSALLHDVGKIGIRDDVLKKPGKLTEEEFNHIKEHPVRSYEVVRQVPQLKGALDGVRHHHERRDGTGYPDGLAGDDIPLQARIIQVADIFDALTTSRSYRGAFHWEKALQILSKEAGTVVDPHLVELFDRLIRREIEENRLTVGAAAPLAAEQDDASEAD